MEAPKVERIVALISWAPTLIEVIPWAFDARCPQCVEAREAADSWRGR